MLSKQVSDVLLSSNIPGISESCLVFTGKIPKGLQTALPANKIVILIQDISNSPDHHGSDFAISKGQTVQLQIFYPSKFSENNMEISKSLNIENNDVELFENEIIKALNEKDIKWSFGSGCLVDPSTNNLYSTYHFNVSKLL